MNGLDRCSVSFVPVPFIGSSGGGIAQVVQRSAVEQVVTLTAGVTATIQHCRPLQCTMMKRLRTLTGT